MSEVVTVELRDELYAVLKQQAESVGISLAEWIAVGLEQQNSLLIQPKTEAEKEVARQRFRRHAGAIWLLTKEGQLKVVADQTNSEKLSDRDIANTFIWLASKNDVEINVYKLQKLVYYAQAWHLGVYGIPLFDRDFQAWIHGPVIPDLLEKYQREFSWEPIIEKIEKPQVSQQIWQFIAEVAEAYFQYDDETLERIVCSEMPWLEARGNLPRDESCHAIISQESMKKYYSARVKEETSV